ncbi:MAG: dienelactone hydrolase family protein [Pseudomonadales bacterium]|jgi:carboxymethylenebutenolidase
MHEVRTVSVSAPGTGSSPMEVFLFRPDGAGPHPGLILAQHIPVGHAGLENDTFTLAAGERFAAAGFVVAAPFIFHWWPKDAEMADKARASRDDWTVADLQAAWALLADEPDVDAARIGIVGHCWGGRVAWLGAAHLDVAACAIFYGGRIKLALGEGNPTAISLADNIGCPVMGFFGNEDQNPSPEDVDDLDAALTAAGVQHTFHRYGGAGHAFQNFPNPERYRETASEDAWTRVLAFFSRTLTPDGRR